MAKSTMVDSAQKSKGIPHDTHDSVTQNILRRLRNIEGQVRGLQRMIEEDQYCIDILTQVSAVRSALNSAGMKVLRRHIETCVSEAIKDGGQIKDEMINELMVILSRQQL
jgi:DNA-binding FrmR family transcriptional regulator